MKDAKDSYTTLMDNLGKTALWAKGASCRHADLAYYFVCFGQNGINLTLMILSDLDFVIRIICIIGCVHKGISIIIGKQ